MEALFLTNRAPRHQKIALQAAPDFLDITIIEAPSRVDILANITGKEVLISERLGSIDAEIIAAADNLKLVQRLGRFTHDIDIEAVRKSGAALCWQPLLVSTLVSEHVLMQVLALAKTYREAAHAMLQPGDWSAPKKCDENHFAYNWTKRQGMKTLADCVVGILGFGEIGASVAQLLRTFGCRVLYNKRNPLPEAVENEFGCRYADLDRIRAESDFLVLLMPHSPGAGESIGADFIKGMKSGACLISTGASTLLNEAEAAQALVSGHLSGLAVDGFVYEPAPLSSPLLALAMERPDLNLILSPHIAGGVSSNDVNARSREFENIRRLQAGRPLLHQIA